MKKNKKVVCPIRNVELFSVEDCFNCKLREKTLLSKDGKTPCQYIDEIEDKLISKEVKAGIIKYGAKKYLEMLLDKSIE